MGLESTVYFDNLTKMSTFAADLLYNRYVKNVFANRTHI